MSKIKLRNYQEIGSNKIVEWLENNPDKNCLGCFITGSGKSLLLASIIKKILFKHPRKRFLVLTSTRELVEQDEQALLALWNTAPSSVYCAGLKRKELGQIIFATIGSIAKKSHDLGSIDYVLIDEVQTVSHKENTQYRQFLNTIKEINPNNQVVGVTATPFRMGGGSLLDEHIFDEMAIDMTDFNSFNWFFNQHYISRLTTKLTATQLDVSNVRTTNGDYNEHDLQEAVDIEETTREALLEAISYGHDRKAWIIFATGIEHCTHITDMLNNEFGIPAVMIHSKMPDSERDDNIAGFKSGKYRACVNNVVLLVGFDHKEIDMIVDLQPTKSVGRHIQKMGRGLRIAPKQGMPLDTVEERIAAIAAGNKPNGCLILDYSQNCRKNGAINDPILPFKKGKGGGNQVLKKCPECGEETFPSVRVCPYCGYLFQFKSDITDFASSTDVIAKVPRSVMTKPPEPEPSWYDVWNVRYTKHIIKSTGIPMLKVSYNPSGLDATEWVGFENPHGTWQRSAAYTWWSKRIVGDMPKTVDEVLEYVAQLPTPTRVYVKSSKGYLNVAKTEFEEGLIIQPLVVIEKEFDVGDVILSSEWGDSDVPF